MFRVLGILCLSMLYSVSIVAAESVPDISAVDMRGNSIELEQLLEENQLVMLTFWIAGCQPCNDLLEYSQAFQNTYGDEGLATIVIYDYCDFTEDIANQFFETSNLSLPVIEDRTGIFGDAYGVCAYPHTIVIDKSGDIFWDDCGYRCGDEVCLQAMLHEQLRGEELLWNEIIYLEN